jgi:hypothetical protein
MWEQVETVNLLKKKRVLHQNTGYFRFRIGKFQWYWSRSNLLYSDVPNFPVSTVEDSGALVLVQ